MPETESLGCGAQADEASAVEHGQRPRYELADVVRQFGSRYLARHPASREQRKVLRAIARCRTSALGGHVDACDRCGHRRQSYNSCRNRHCPKCQGRNRTREDSHCKIESRRYEHDVLGGSPRSGQGR